MSEGQIIILIANILAGVGTFLFTISSVFKSKKRILGTQCIYHLGFAVAADIMLSGWVGLFQEVMSGIRNIFVIFNKNTKVVNITIIVVAVLLSGFGLYVEALGIHWGALVIKGKSETGDFWDYIWHQGGWMGFLPIVANLQYSVVVLKSKHPITLRVSLLISAVAWSTYLFYINSYVSASLNLLSLVINTYQLVSYIVFLRKNGISIKESYVTLHKTGNIVNNDTKEVKEEIEEPKEATEAKPEVESN